MLAPLARSRLRVSVWCNRPTWWLHRNVVLLWSDALPTCAGSPATIRLLSATHCCSWSQIVAGQLILWFGISAREASDRDPTGWVEQIRLHLVRVDCNLACEPGPWQNAEWISWIFTPARMARRAATPQRPGGGVPIPAAAVSRHKRTPNHSPPWRSGSGLWVCEALGHGVVRSRMQPGVSVPRCDPHHRAIGMAAGGFPVIPNRSQPPAALIWHRRPWRCISSKDRPGLLTSSGRSHPVTGRTSTCLLLEWLWDLGAGIGSVGLEALRLQPQLQLMAVKWQRIRLIQANARRLLSKCEQKQCSRVMHIKSGALDRSRPRLLGGGSRQRQYDAGGDRAHERSGVG